MNASHAPVRPPRRRALAALTLATLAVAGATVGATLWLRPAPSHAAPAPGPAADLLARGRYLTNIMGCHDCHTPWKMGPDGPAPDMTRMLSGHPADFVVAQAPAAPAFPWVAQIAATNTAWAGPWGVSFTANLTPDKETGLGTWDLTTFRTAIRTGKHQGKGRPILPPMPWPMYRNLTDADFEALFAYLQSIPAISNRVPEPLPPAERPPAETPAAAPGR